VADERRYYSESDPEWSVRQLAASHAGAHVEGRRPVNVKLAAIVLASALTITVLMAVAWNPRNRHVTPDSQGPVASQPTARPTGTPTGPAAVPVDVERRVTLHAASPSDTPANTPAPTTPVATVTQIVPVVPAPTRHHRTVGQPVGPNPPVKHPVDPNK
jgi:hypothetical protein